MVGRCRAADPPGGDPPDMSSTTDPARRSRTVVALGVFVPAVVLLAACGGSKRAAPRTTTTRPKAPTATTTQRSAVTTSSPCGRVTTPPRWQHVIVVIFENHRHGDVIDNRAAPYATELARECGTATNWSDAGSAYPSLPNYIGLTSGQDGKDVGITGDCDAGAANFFPSIFASKAYRDGRTTVLWLWDEDTPIPNVIVSPATRPGTVSADAISHYSALRAIEEIFGLPLLGHANGARDMRPLFNL